MEKNMEMMIYDMAFRVRLYIASIAAGKRVADLTDRESLILELLGMKGSMSISEIGKLCPGISISTISTTITKLWKENGLVDKKILPENQRVTTVSLTAKGQEVLAEIIKTWSEVFSTVTTSLGLPPEQFEYIQAILDNAIGYFDKTLGLQLDDQAS